VDSYNGCICVCLALLDSWLVSKLGLVECDVVSLHADVRLG
jgi:hypothetical protein